MLILPGFLIFYRILLVIRGIVPAAGKDAVNYEKMIENVGFFKIFQICASTQSLQIFIEVMD